MTTDVAIDEVGVPVASRAEGQPHALSRGRATTAEDGLATVAIFPGLGSRSAYRDVGAWSIGSDLAVVDDLYQEAADALGIPTGPAGLALTAQNLPADPVERQGFIGAALLVHNLAIHADLHARGTRSGHLHVAAYTGESFGMLASAVAAGAITVADGARVARVFTPLLLAASDQRAAGAFGRSIDRYLPRHSSESPPVDEPFHVIGLRSTPEALHRVVELLTQRHANDVEVHKRYSRHQVNVYVRASFIATFVSILRSYPEIEAKELKPPTTFLAHSRRMIGAREALARYLDEQQLSFRTPRTPLLSNSGRGFLLTADHVRQAVLAMTDEVMDTQRTVEMIDELRPDLVVEVGRGGRSLEVLRDNTAQAHALAVADAAGAAALVAGADLVHDLQVATRSLRTRPEADLSPADLATLREVVALAQREPAFDGYLRRRVCEMGREAVRHPERDQSPALRRFRETLQHTLAHRAHVQPGGLVLAARLRKRLVGEEVGRAPSCRSSTPRAVSGSRRSSRSRTPRRWSCTSSRSDALRRSASSRSSATWSARSPRPGGSRTRSSRSGRWTARTTVRRSTWSSPAPRPSTCSSTSSACSSSCGGTARASSTRTTSSSRPATRSAGSWGSRRPAPRTRRRSSRSRPSCCSGGATTGAPRTWCRPCATG